MKTKNLTICAFSAAIIALCAWISIPMGIPFTLQTLAIFFICGAFGNGRFPAFFYNYFAAG